jgi:hypothetical protein
MYESQDFVFSDFPTKILYEFLILQMLHPYYVLRGTTALTGASRR